MYKSLQDLNETSLLIHRTKDQFYSQDPNRIPLLLRQKHIQYLLDILDGDDDLSFEYISLDSSYPWICFWICQSLSLLGYKLSSGQKTKIFSTLSQCKCPNGGFSGSPKVLFPHLASTYAAVATIALLGEPKYWDDLVVVGEEGEICSFLLSLRQPDGSWSMHEDGESDTRAIYCAIATAYMCGVDWNCLELEKTVEFIRSCQNWDGGIGPQKGVESHGGYSYCGYAALCLIGQQGAIDEKRLVEWACARQNADLGGFQGRTGKLVDGCYSFWLGGLLELLGEYGGFRFEPWERADWLLYDQLGLQEWVLVCCQEDDGGGGLRDKPDCPPDLYHTCYVLAGLAAAQSKGTFVLGEGENLVCKNNSLLNVCGNWGEQMREYFLINKHHHRV